MNKDLSYENQKTKVLLNPESSHYLNKVFNLKLLIISPAARNTKIYSFSFKIKFVFAKRSQLRCPEDSVPHVLNFTHF